MNLPVQREPVQRSIVGLTRGNPSLMHECVTRGAAVEQGVEPSGLGWIDDMMEQQIAMNKVSLPTLPTFYHL
jgi:hypothetical protein